MSRLLWGNGWNLNANSGQLRTPNLTLGKTVKLQAIRRLCNRLLVIMLNSWWVNECWIVDITEFLIQKLSDVSATKIFLEYGRDECDNLNFMNFKIDNLKICKNSCIIGNFKIRKIRILGVWCVRNLLYTSDYCRVNYVICVLLQRHRTLLHLRCLLRQFWYVNSTTPFKVVCSYIITSKWLQSNKR